MSIAKCKECGKEVSTSAKACPHCGKKYPTGGLSLPLKIFLVLLAIIFVPALFRYCGNTTTPNVSTPTKQKDYNIKTYSDEQIHSAQKIMNIAREDCNIFEEGPHLVVEMKMYINNPNQLLRYIRAIADSDVVLHGRTRNIYFYDPSNKKIAQADTLHGVRLVD